MKLVFNINWLRIIVVLLCFSSTRAFAGPGDTVTVALNVDPTTVNILESKLGVDIVIQHMHENIMSSDPVTGDLEPSLASSITIMPNHKDIKVELEKNHSFHTGDPLTAHDIKWTYEQCTLPQNAHMIAGSLEEIENIEVVDDDTLIFHYYEKFAPWKENFWIGICSQKYFEKVGRDTFRSHPVGSGPFKFVSRKIGENVIMEAVEGYTYPVNTYDKTNTKIIKRKASKGTIDFKTLKFITVTDSITRLAMLETGEIDLTYNLLPQDAKRIGMNPKIKVKKSSNVPSYFGLATKPLLFPIMTDQKFQQALTHAINRQEIIDKIFLGEGYPLYMWASRSELGYDPSFTIKFDPELARKLVKESSYNGESIILTFTNIVPNAGVIASVIQQYLKDVGIAVKLQQLEGGVQATYARNRDKREGHMTLFSWAGSRDPHLRLLLTLPSDSIYASYPGRPSKEILDKLVQQQAKETDQTKRLAILKKIHAIIAKEPSSIALYGLNQIYAMPKRIDYTWTPKAIQPFNLTRIKVK